MAAPLGGGGGGRRVAAVRWTRKWAVPEEAKGLAAVAVERRVTVVAGVGLAGDAARAVKVGARRIHVSLSGVALLPSVANSSS